MNDGSSPPQTLGRRLWRAVGGMPLPAMVLLVAMAGGAVGLGGFTFTYARGYSYLSNDPRACANCHVMREVFDAWNHGSHKAVAACNDCHTPHNLIGKYAIKAYDGWKHSLAFTLDDIPEPIRITVLNREIAQENCLRCHGDLVAAISHTGDAQETDCLTCHVGVGHSH